VIGVVVVVWQVVVSHLFHFTNVAVTVVVGVIVLARDEDGDGGGDLREAEDAAGEGSITEGGGLLWRRDRALVHTFNRAQATPFAEAEKAWLLVQTC
jgi:hypothetical protein